MKKKSIVLMIAILSLSIWGCRKVPKNVQREVLEQTDDVYKSIKKRKFSPKHRQQVLKTYTKTCNACQGTGKIVTGRDYYGNYLWSYCTSCGGTGKVKVQKLEWE